MLSYLPENAKTQNISRDTQQQGGGWHDAAVHHRLGHLYRVRRCHWITRFPWTNGQGGIIARLVHCDNKVTVHSSRYLWDFDRKTK